MPEQRESRSAQIAETREALGRKIAQFEEHFDEDKKNVKEVVEKVKSTVQHLSLSYQIKKHPLPAVGAASMAGFFFTRWLLKPGAGTRIPQTRAKSSVWSELGEQFRCELKSAQGIIIAAAVEAAARKVASALTKTKEDSSILNQEPPLNS